jgi:hypothetical protein
MDAVSSSETLVNFYQTTRCNIPEDSHLRRVTGYYYFANSKHNYKSNATESNVMLLIYNANEFRTMYGAL